MIAVAEIYHARLGASGASGWLGCSAWRGGGGASIYSATGSVIHEVAAKCLGDGTSPDTALTKEYSSGGFAVRFSQAHADIAHCYVNYCRDLHNALGGARLIEVSLPIAHITGEPEAVSTIDFGIIPGAGQTEAMVVDLKTGAGVPVLASDSPQLIMYALAMLDAYSLVADIQSVRMVIVQPPLNSISECVITVPELEQWRTRFAAAAALAMGSDPLATPGTKQCRWCTRKAVCGALSAEMFDDLDAINPPVVSVDELGYAMNKVELMEGWCKAVRAEAESRLLSGRHVTGWKLVQGKRGNRAWSQASEVEALLKSMRLKVQEMYDLSLISPTSAERLAKSALIGPRQWSKVQALISQREGLPTVVPQADKREALRMPSAFADLDAPTLHASPLHP